MSAAAAMAPRRHGSSPGHLLGNSTSEVRGSGPGDDLRDNRLGLCDDVPNGPGDGPGDGPSDGLGRDLGNGLSNGLSNGFGNGLGNRGGAAGAVP